MSNSVEDRLRRLEESRYRAVGEMNAMRTLLLSAWMTLIQRSSLPAAEVVAQLKETFHPSKLMPQKAFPGIDPSELEAFSQEYEKSLTALLSDLERAVLK